MSEFGNKALIEHRDGRKVALQLPGVRKGDLASRKFRPEVRVFCLQFSPTGKYYYDDVFIVSHFAAVSHKHVLFHHCIL